MLYCLLLYLTNSYYSIRYKFKENEAVELADFLQPMLNYDPDKRISAQELLKHKWLNMPANFEYTMNEKEYQKIKQGLLKAYSKLGEIPELYAVAGGKIKKIPVACSPQAWASSALLNFILEK